MKTVRLIIHGKVQGVYYRASARQRANELGITGWTRNLPDRTVEITATGDEASLQLFIDWCRKGPANALVDDVLINEHPVTAFPDFRIVRYESLH